MLDAVDDVGERLVARGFVGVADRAELVELVLEDVGLIEPDADPAGAPALRATAAGSVPPAKSHSTCIATVGQQPVSRWTWAASASLSSSVDRRGGLVELAEPGARVGVAPGRGFDAEGVEGAVDGFRRGHGRGRRRGREGLD